MSGWQPTETLVRSLIGGAACAVVAVAFGRPDLWVLGAPLLVTAVLALLHRPPVRDEPEAPAVHLGNRSRARGPADHGDRAE